MRLISVIRLFSLFMIISSWSWSFPSAQDFLPAQGPHPDNKWTSPHDLPPRTRNRIIDMITVLQEYRDTDTRIRTLTEGKQGAAGTISRDGSGGGYIVRIGRGGQKFESYFIFHVDGSTFHIKVYDVLEDRYITLEALRSRGTAELPTE